MSSLLAVTLSATVLLAAPRAERTPADKVALGRRLFEDRSFSEPATTACATCHEPGKAFTGNAGSSIPAVAAGSRPGVYGTRNVPSLAYASFVPPLRFELEVNPDGKSAWVAHGGLFWDGRADDLEHQALGPLLNPAEMNNAGPRALTNKLHRDEYARLLTNVYGAAALSSSQADTLVGDALAAYERSPVLQPFRSKFDDYLRGQVALSPLEREGLAIFSDSKRGNCLACHAGDTASREPAAWLFTDFSYDVLGVPRNRQIPANYAATYFDLGLCDSPELATHLPAGATRERLCGAFRVPTLRNIALTAPYMHNGYFKSLRDVLRFYATRDTNPELWYPQRADGTLDVFDDLPEKYRANVNRDEVPYGRKRGERPALSELEMDALEAFLGTLTDR